MPRIRTIIPGVDKKLLIKDAAELMPDPTRRWFLHGASLGALTLLTGCDIIDSDAAEGTLRRISKFNDGVHVFVLVAKPAGRRPSRHPCRHHRQRGGPREPNVQVDGHLAW